MIWCLQKIWFKQAVFGHMRDKERGEWSTFTIRSLITCTSHKILLEWYNGYDISRHGEDGGKKCKFLEGKKTEGESHLGSLYGNLKLRLRTSEM
jgi:hypothetical protein